MARQRINAETRQAVTEWASRGFYVVLDLNDGKISVTREGPPPKGAVHPCDLLDLS